MSLSKLVVDFFIAGGLIAVVLEIANLMGPFIAGIIAALPLRVWMTLLIAGTTESPEFIMSLLRGIIPGSFGAWTFMITLSFSTRKWGIWKSFALACITCTCVTLIGLVVFA